ncbi:lincomycin resistance ABC-F type ribosomal protection protein [Philodulcilactobacillus myokoensis]|uniref:Lincomycin resistance ABC-F type ribosomal protection protein n=1 Tax=Philodulcilactobacillus myokoensis TaxID=2929573 RepID=A0A9W6B0T3_9LACO|nr:ATP-binding cassette domain-containing protein [Philodulcilactobacillus myokoensis]GLB46348.1 lincomycin resistance ABC-F type ribosomal protection protein [Philodulcilactobacillus myokoensis]
MTYYQANNLTKNIGASNIFKIKHLGFHQNDRIGLIGNNGVGKTLLLKLLSSDHSPLTPDAKKFLLPQIKPNLNLSGGQIVRKYLDQTFASNADIIFLDEPTVDLDIHNIEFLENQLKHYQGTIIVISHDRTFLDHTINTIWELQDHHLNVYHGNYSYYRNAKKHKNELAWKNYYQDQIKRKQLEHATVVQEIQTNRSTKVPRQKVGNNESGREKGYYNQKQGRMQHKVNAMKTRLNKMPQVNRPQIEKPIKMSVNQEDAINKGSILTINHLNLKRNHKLLIKDINFKINGGDKVALMGSNGSGKTTLLNVIDEHNDSKIAIHSKVKIGYFKQQLEDLNVHQTIMQNVTSTSFQDNEMVRTVLARLGFKSNMINQRVATLSGGERVKVSLAKIFLSDANLLMLDEPTNFLDISAMNALQKLLANYPGTVLFVSHDRYFLNQVATRKVTIQNHRLIDERYQNQSSHNHDDQKEWLMLLKNRQSSLINELSEDPHNPHLNQAFKKISQRIKKL